MSCTSKLGHVTHDCVSWFLFIYSCVAIARFKVAVYSVFEGNRNFSVVVEKLGVNYEQLTLFVQFADITTTSE